MKTSVLMAACNAGYMLKETVASIRQSSDDNANVEIVIVDDCSKDGCCDDIGDVRLIHAEQRLGCSGARHLAGQHATGDVLIISDPHCSFPDGSIEMLAESCSVFNGIVQPPVVLEGHGRKRAATMEITKRGLTTKVVTYLPKYPIMLGSIYAFNRDVWDRTAQYPVLPGWWDCDENYISSIAYRVGLSVKTDKSIPRCTHRKYRKTGRLPFSLPTHHQDLNAHWFHAVCFPRYYQKMFKAMLDESASRTDTEIYMDADNFMDACEFVERNAVRTEFWFMRNVVR